MCKYASSCQHCGFLIDIFTEYKNMQDVTLDVSSDCPNLDSVTKDSITLDAIRELVVPKDKSDFMKLLDGHSHPEDCTAYKIIIDAIGKGLGRYYELA